MFKDSRTAFKGLKYNSLCSLCSLCFIYQLTRYVTELMELPYAVGFHWFEYADQPKEGRGDGENCNYGLVNVEDKPWEILTQKMSEVNRKIEAIHK